MHKHSTLDPVMVSIVSSAPTGGNFLKFFKPLDVNFGLKCKCDLVVKNSKERTLDLSSVIQMFSVRFLGTQDLDILVLSGLSLLKRMEMALNSLIKMHCNDLCILPDFLY